MSEFIPIGRWIAVAVLALASSASLAGNKTSPVGYQSALTGYQPMQDTAEPTANNWRQVNEAVARAAGHAPPAKDAASLPASEQHQDPKQKSQSTGQPMPMQHKH